MKYFYSYYSKHIKNNEELFFNIIMIKLSSSFLKKMNKKIGIYSDKKFIDLLKEYNVNLDFYENIENEIKSISTDKLFAVCKLYSNIIQTEPFIQLDTDLFLFNNYNFNLLESSNVSFYSTETINWSSPPSHYTGWEFSYLNPFNKLLNNFPHLIYKDYINPLIAYNCAVVGGKDWKVFRELYEPIFDTIKNNKEYLNTISDYPMPVLEQHIITGHLNKLGYNLSNINFISDNKIPYLFVNNTDLFLKINEFKDIKLPKPSESINEVDKQELFNLKKEKFNGSMHLQGAKGLPIIKNLVYEMLKYNEPEYVEWLERNFGKKHEFQKI